MHKEWQMVFFLKGIVHPKGFIFIFITHPHVILNLYGLLPSSEHKEDIFNYVGNQFSIEEQQS